MANQFPHPFGEMAKKYRKFRRELPVVVSNMAVNEFKENFRRGGYRDSAGVQKWKKRKKNKGKRNSTRAVLVKSGRLKRSMRPKPTYDEARVVTDVPYAKAHNEGFKGTVQVKAHKRKRTRAAKKVKGKKGRTGPIKVKSHKRKVEMEARPFMITTEPLLKDIDTYAGNELDKLFSQ